jgi:pimeloyl-ACP methyl ester carboxylesterase
MSGREPHPDPEELTIEAAGLRHAARAWGRPGARPILAFHGWLDSAGTWDRLAPQLVAQRDVRIVALDFAGHGRSEHRGRDGWYGFADYLYSAVQVLDALGWDDCTLMGHSMGAVVAALTAGVAPDRFRAVALVEGIAPMTSEAGEARDQMRKGIASHQKYAAYGPRVLPDFTTICSRIAARPWRLTTEAVEALALRGAMEVDGGWAFTHDPRLKAESLVRMTPEQVLSFLRGISAPTLLVVADDGIPYPEELARAYVRAVEGIRVVNVPGRHHVHLDAPEVVLPHVVALLDHTAP